MTRKDFQLIADVLKASSTTPMERCVIEQLALTFATELAKTNPNFNQQRFISACFAPGRERAQVRAKAVDYIEVRDLTPEEEAKLKIACAENLRNACTA